MFDAMKDCCNPSIMHYLKYSHNPFCMDFNLGHRSGTNEEVLYLKLPSPFYCYHFLVYILMYCCKDLNLV